MCSNKMETITVKQDALDGRLDGFTAELRGQGGKLSSLEATLVQVQEVSCFSDVWKQVFCGCSGWQTSGLAQQARLKWSSKSCRC